MSNKNPHLQEGSAQSGTFCHAIKSPFPSCGIRGSIKNFSVAFAICTVSLVSSALSATYHVSSTGSDTNDGSSATPWKTIKYASNQVVGGLGHTIQVAAGTYTETGGFNLREGTNLIGAGIDQTILTGVGGVGEGKLVLINLRSELNNTTSQRLTGFTIDGIDRTARSGIQIQKRHYVEIDHIKIKNVYNPGIELKSNYNASTNSSAPADDQYIRGHKIHHNILEHCGRTNFNVTTTGKKWTDWDGAIQIVQDEDCEIYNNTIINTNIEDGAGIKGFNSGGWHRGLKVYNNVISNARKHVEVEGDSTQWGSTASIEFSKCQDDCEVYNNTFGQWTSFPGGSKGNGTYGLIYHHNTVVLPEGGHGPEGIEVSSDQHIYNNYFEGFKLGITTTKPSGTVNVIVHDNVFLGAGSGRPISLGRTGKDYKINNNTFDNYPVGIYFGSSATFENIEIKNNIFNNIKELVNVQTGTTLANVVIDHNLFHMWTIKRSGNQDQPLTWTNNLGMTAPGVDPGLIAAGEKPAPWFTSSLNSSAVVDAGTVIPGITDSHEGSAPDIGAYERGAVEKIGATNGGHTVAFEASQGYSPGEVNGQDGWSANPAWVVVSNPQGNGTSLRGNTGLRYQSLKRSFSSSEIGGTLDSSSSQLAYYFDYHADSGIAGWNVQRFAVGGDYGYAPSFQPRSSSNNIWRYSSGGSDYIAKNAIGQNYSFIGKGWVTIDGVINYATRSYTLFVDDIQQMGGTSDGWLPFPNGNDPSKFSASFYGYLDKIAAPIHLDDISLTLVSSPTGGDEASSELLTFDNYNLNAINGQDGWSASNSWVVISNTEGSGKSLRAESGARYQSINRSFSPAETGGLLDTSNSRLAYQFDYHADSGVAGWNVQRFAIGGDYGFAPSFQPRSSFDNVWRYFSGGSEYTAITETNQTYSFLGKGWVTIGGVIDYATGRYTLSIDGIQQMGGTSDGWLSFPNSGDTSKLGARFYGYVDQIASPIHMDNLLLQVQP